MSDPQKKRRFSPPWQALLLLGVGLVSLLIYQQTGRFELVQQGEKLHQTFLQTQAVSSESDPLLRETGKQNDRYIHSLQQRLRQNPNDGDLWFELGQAYSLNNDFAAALVCYQNAEKVLGKKAAILGAMATADYYENRQQLSPQAADWLEQALKLDPQESSSLLLLAADAFLQNEYEQALTYWRKVLDSDNQAINRKAIIESMQLAHQMWQNQKTPSQK